MRHLLEGEELFLANYGDTLTDAPLDRIVEDFRDRCGGIVPVGPTRIYPFRVLDADGDGTFGAAAPRATPTSGSMAATSSSARRSST